MKIILILLMGMCLIGMLPLAFLGVAHFHTGQGLHPALAGFGVAVLLGLGWQAACMIDSE